MIDFFERKIEIGGGSFQVRIEGEGPPLLLLHGFTGSIETMSDFSAALRNHFCVISVDLPGHGRTSVPDDPVWYTFPKCNSVLVHILNYLSIEKCFICGYSMGGRMALVFGATVPSRVAAIATIGASGGIEDKKQRDSRRKEDEKLASFIESEGIEPFVKKWMDHPLFAGQRKLGETFLGKSCRQRLSNDPYSLACSLRGMGTGVQTPVYRELQQLDIPMLFVAGEEDKKFCDLALQLKTKCQRGCTHFIRQAGHAAHLENRALSAEAVTAFFQRTPGINIKMNYSATMIA